MTQKFEKAPNNPHTKNTMDGEKRSAIDKTAKIRVPEINPNCTIEVICPNTLACRSKCSMRSESTPLLANHKEVQQNWAKTITGRINLFGSIYPAKLCMQSYRRSFNAYEFYPEFQISRSIVFSKSPFEIYKKKRFTNLSFCIYPVNIATLSGLHSFTNIVLYWQIQVCGIPALH